MGNQIAVPRMPQPATVGQGNQAATNAANMRAIQLRLGGWRSTITNQMPPFGNAPKGMPTPPMAIPGR